MQLLPNSSSHFSVTHLQYLKPSACGYGCTFSSCRKENTLGTTGCPLDKAVGPEDTAMCFRPWVQQHPVRVKARGSLWDTSSTTYSWNEQTNPKGIFCMQAAIVAKALLGCRRSGAVHTPTPSSALLKTENACEKQQMSQLQGRWALCTSRTALALKEFIQKGTEPAPETEPSTSTIGRE